MFFSYKFTLFLCLIIFFGYIEVDANRALYFERNVNLIENDFPSSHKDLFDYVKSLEEISNFALKYNRYLDINFCFGLFVVNVNLRPFINHPNVTENFRERLWNILKINDELIENFINTQSGDKSDDLKRINQIKQSLLMPVKNGTAAYLLGTAVYILVWTHMSNEAVWTKRIKKFNFDLLIDGKMAKKLEEDPAYKIVYPDWNVYLYTVNHLEENYPDPKSSNECIVQLSENAENPTDQYQRCRFSEKCTDILLKGNDFGYSLTHRFLYMVLARISRGCYIFSPEKDQELRNEFCETMYEESNYLAINGFKLIDLFLEQVCLCSLDGHAQFLRRSWLSKLLAQQSPYGCFNQHQEKDQNEASILNGECNTHVTSVAAGTLAAAVRFILEKY